MGALRHRLLLLAVCVLLPASLGRAQAPNGAAAATPTPTPTPLSSDTYAIVAGDKLILRIEEDPAKNREPRELMVLALGDVDFPVSRDSDLTITLNVRGKTVQAVREELRKRLEADYYKTATLKLSVIDPNQRRGTVYFFGAVHGTIQLVPSEPMTVSEAILRLGYDQYANLKKVRIDRLVPQTKQTRSISVNVREVLDKNLRDKDELLQDGDRVSTPDLKVIFN